MASYLTPEGERLTDDFQRTVYLRTVQDWIIRPQMKSVPGVAGADAIGGYVKQYLVQPDPARLIAYGLSFGRYREGDRSQQCQPRRQLYRAQRRRLRGARQRPRRDPGGDRGHRRRDPRGGAGAHQGRCRGHARTRAPHRQRQRERPRGRPRHGADADRRQQPYRRGGGRRQDQGDQPHAAAGHPRAHCAQPHRARRSHDPHGGERTSPKAPCWSFWCSSCCSAISVPR